MFKELLNDNERGVSPVIGVILMVAITVILAAVIGAFVLDLGNSVSNTAPQASIGVGDISQADNTIELEHSGGDTVEFSETEIIVTNESDGTELTWDGTVNEPFSTADNAVIYTDDANITVGGTGYPDDDDNTFDLADNGLVTITLLDKQSGEIIAERELRG